MNRIKTSHYEAHAPKPSTGVKNPDSTDLRASRPANAPGPLQLALQRTGPANNYASAVQRMRRPGAPAASVLLPLQRAAGNRAVASLFAPNVIQRDIKEYKNDDMEEKTPDYADKADTAVDTAVKTIAADPYLKSVPGSDKGYLKRWVATFSEYAGTPGVVPKFFYARYGYAVETIACNLLKNEDISPCQYLFQVSHGHTRPDIVVVNKKNEVGWLDITSAASKGHIKEKQGAGWSSRPYVAEIIYDMPAPASLLTSFKDIDPETLKKLNEATLAAAQEEAWFEKGREDIATHIGAAFYQKIKERGEGLTQSNTRELTTATCREKIDEETPPKVAAGILALLEEIEIIPDGDLQDGESWARWAYDVIDKANARLALIAHGKKLP